MPICIECSYPVPQLYHVFHSGSHKGPIPPAVPPKPSPLTSAAATAADGTTRTAPPLDKRRGKVKKESASGTPAGAGPTAAGAGTGARTGGGRGGGGGAGGGSGVGGDVRLTQCPRCKRFADKYVEHDYVVLFIDLVLVKPQVYRHLLFNRLHRDDDDINPSIIRLGTLLLLFDVYITWSHIELLPQDLTSGLRITHLPILLQYCFFLCLCLAITASQHVTVRWLAKLAGLSGSAAEGGRRASSSDVQQQQQQQNPPANTAGNSNPSTSGSISSPAPTTTSTSTSTSTPTRKPSPNSVSTALFVSSCMSLFPLLMVVWKYDDDSTTTVTPPNPLNTTIAASTSALQSRNTSTVAFANGFLAPSAAAGPGGHVDWVRRGVAWIVAAQNLEALRILLGCGYLTAGALVGAGEMVKWIVRTGILRAVGFE